MGKGVVVNVFKCQETARSLAVSLGDGQWFLVPAFVGVPGLEPGLQNPQLCVLPIYYTPQISMDDIIKGWKKQKDATESDTLFQSKIGLLLCVKTAVLIGKLERS